MLVIPSERVVLAVVLSMVVVSSNVPPVRAGIRCAPMQQPEFRVLRDYAEPGATRRMHSHDEATWHVFTLVTGQLLVTIEGEQPVEVTQGQVLNLKGGAKHTFRNTGTVTATIVEVFGKAPKP